MVVVVAVAVAAAVRGPVPKVMAAGHGRHKMQVQGPAVYMPIRAALAGCKCIATCIVSNRHVYRHVYRHVHRHGKLEPHSLVAGFRNAWMLKHLVPALNGAFHNWQTFHLCPEKMMLWDDDLGR